MILFSLNDHQFLVQTSSSCVTDITSYLIRNCKGLNACKIWPGQRVTFSNFPCNGGDNYYMISYICSRECRKLGFHDIHPKRQV